MPALPYAVRYDPLATPETGHVEEYKLLEVSAELAKVIEDAERDGEDAVRLTMKGTPSDDAVICTPNHTFTLRTITVSNSIIFLRPSASSPATSSSGTQGDLYIQDTCHEILELTPSVPRLARIEKLLKPSAWRGMVPRGTKRAREDAGEGEGEGEGRRVKRYTRAQMQSIVQSSDGELDAGLRERNVIRVDEDHLLHLPTRHLSPLLSTILSLLTIHAPPPSSPTPTTRPRVPTGPIIDALESEYGVPADVGRGVMDLCGSLEGDGGTTTWVADLERMVAEVGKGVLQLESTIDPPFVDDFMAKWREAVTGYEHIVDLKLLGGAHLLKPSTIPGKGTHIIPFNVAHLPTDPAARFHDLFLTRARWRPEEMEPFLRGLVRRGDGKAMDRLVVKYVRVVKESGRAGSVVWWHARR